MHRTEQVEVVKIDPAGSLRRTSKSPYWEYRVYRAGKGRLEQTTKQKDLRKAKHEAARMYQDWLRARSTSTVEIQDLLDLVRRDQLRNDRRAWHNHVRPIIENHLAPSLGSIRASQLSSEIIEAYRDRKVADGYEITTVNRHFTVLLRAYKLGLQHEPPLVDRIPRIPKADETDHIRDVLVSDQELEQLLLHLPIDAAEGILVMATYGWRKGEAYKHLTWPNVDLGRHLMYLPVARTKNKKPRLIYMTEEVYAIVSRRKEERDRLWPQQSLVFYNSSNGRPYPDSMFYAQWKAAAEAIGRPDIRPHDLRRHGVTTMVSDAGISEKVAMSISGHATSAMLKRYQIMRPQDLMNATKRLEEFRKVGGKLGEVGGNGNDQP